MNTKLLTIFTRTPLHIGAGSSVGAVDQPVVRERHTGYPVIPGSALKGVLADLWLKRNPDGSIFFKETAKTIKKENGGEEKKTIYESVRDEEGIKILGNTDNKNASAGSLLIGEGKLLAFPVRSAKGCWAWLTCPFALKRFARDCGKATNGDFALEPSNDGAYAPNKLQVGGQVVFEEYPLKVENERKNVLDKAIDLLKDISDDEVWKTLADHLAIVSDELFAYFAQNACEIANHNRIDDKTGVVANGALFSQENVPSETMFYSVLNTQKSEDFEKLDVMLGLKEKPADWTSDNQKIYDYPVNKLLQIGADMTTGLGWCSVATKNVVTKEVK